MNKQVFKDTLIRIITISLSLSLLCSQYSLAHEGHHHHADTPATEKDLEEQSHSIQGVLVPFLFFNMAQLTYEYKFTPKLGLRADAFAHLSLAAYALIGNLALSYIAAEARSTSASHGLELDLGVGLGGVGPGHCNADVSDCSSREGLFIKSFVGYRYQKFSGFQFRIGASPIIDMNGDWMPFPEMTLGTSF